MNNKTVKEFFCSIPRDKTLYYRSNPGNAGDALIAAGTFHLFDELGFELKFIDPDNFDAEGKIVVYAGGGNFNHIYPEARAFMEMHHQKAEQFILLPHTITENEDLLSRLGSNVTLFAREEKSFAHIQKHANNCHTYIDHDMALHINTDTILKSRFPSLKQAILRKTLQKLSRRQNNDALPSIKKMAEINRYERQQKLSDQNHGFFFRTDVEASGRPIPDNNADLSVIYELSTRSRAIIEYTVWLLMSHIDQFTKVSTDRLHICVAAALLGKPVLFYGNSYFKCKAVYDYSLQARFKNIEWQR